MPAHGNLAERLAHLALRCQEWVHRLEVCSYTSSPFASASGVATAPVASRRRNRPLGLNAQ
jgi:hypothetical protein